MGRVFAAGFLFFLLKGLAWVAIGGIGALVALNGSQP
jgi:hypothetical protein